MTDRRIRVLLAADHAMFRQSIREMLSTGEEIDVVGEAENGREAVVLAEKLRPDVVLLDVEMPVVGAKQVIEIMLENSPPPRVVIVTMYEDPKLVRELTGLGAVVCLVKSATMEELHAAVHTAANSATGPDKDVVIVAPPKAFRDRAEADGLSKRELEVVLMVARGMSNYQIAISLHLSEATIKRHLANIYPQDRGLLPRRGREEGPLEKMDQPPRHYRRRGPRSLERVSTSASQHLAWARIRVGKPNICECPSLTGAARGRGA